MPSTGPQSSGDFDPDLSPDSACARGDETAEAAPPVPELSSRIMAVGTTRFMARATSPTVPALLSPSNGWSTATPKTGVADVASISAQIIESGPCNLFNLRKLNQETRKPPTCANIRATTILPCTGTRSGGICL